jgi:cytidylate kinase
MGKQFIISISREYGAGGHCIAQMLSEKYNLPLYDKSILENVAQEKGVNAKELEKFDELPKNRLFSRTVSGYSNSPQDVVAQMQFDFLNEKAQSGESFIVLGRCANSVLKDYDGLISIFLTANMESKIERISKLYDLSTEEAEKLILKINKKRKSYHNYYCKEKWGDSRYYELTVNTSKIGIDKTCEIVEKYIDARMGK